MELQRKNLIQYYKGVKGPFIFIVSSYLVLVIILISSTTTNTSHLIFVIAWWTFLIAWILYSVYAEHQRLVTALEKSEVLNYLNGRSFHLEEKTVFFSYDLNFEGHLEDCFIVVAITKQQGLFWNKYYLNLLGLRDDQLRQVETGYSEKMNFKVYSESIRLTTNTDTKSRLDEGLGQFIKELGTKD
jgi:hypothetical protein